MSIYASWQAVGEHEEDWSYTGEVLTYMRSHVYPDPVEHKPATVGISVIPGFIRRDTDQDEDAPYAPYLRLDVAPWNDEFGQPMIGADVVLTRAGAIKLRDQLSMWIDSPMHDD